MLPWRLRRYPGAGLQRRPPRVPAPRSRVHPRLRARRRAAQDSLENPVYSELVRTLRRVRPGSLQAASPALSLEVRAALKVRRLSEAVREELSREASHLEPVELAARRTMAARALLRTPLRAFVRRCASAGPLPLPPEPGRAH